MSAPYTPGGRRPPTDAWQSRFWQIVVRVEADDGTVGYGYGGGGDPACLVVNRHFRDLVVGRVVESPDDIRAVWDHVYALSLPYGRKGLTVMALSGLDLALWDLLGKAQGRPVYDLLGGLRKPRVRAYATGEAFERHRDMGYTAAKFGPAKSESKADLPKTVDTARRARSVFGDDALVMTDCYMSWDFETTVRMADALREFDLYWFEDVTTPDHLEEAGGAEGDRSPREDRWWRARVHALRLRTGRPGRGARHMAARHHVVRRDHRDAAHPRYRPRARNPRRAPSRRGDMGPARDGGHGLRRPRRDSPP